MEKSEMCIMWRMRLKTLSVEERAHYKDLLKDVQLKKMGKMKEAKSQLKDAVDSGDEKAISKAKAELAEVKEHGRALWEEIRRAWCEEGEGKEDLVATSPARTSGPRAGLPC